MESVETKTRCGIFGAELFQRPIFTRSAESLGVSSKGDVVIGGSDLPPKDLSKGDKCVASARVLLQGSLKQLSLQSEPRSVGTTIGEQTYPRMLGKNKEAKILATAFRPGSRDELAVIYAGNHFRQSGFFNTQTGERVPLYFYKSSNHSLRTAVYSSNGAFLAVANALRDGRGGVRIHTTNYGELVNTAELPLPINCLAISDKDRIIAGGGRKKEKSEEGMLGILELSSDGIISLKKAYKSSDYNRIRAIVHVPSADTSDRFVCADSNKLYSVKGQLVGNPEWNVDRNREIRALASSPDYFAVASEDKYRHSPHSYHSYPAHPQGTIHILDVNSMKELCRKEINFPMGSAQALAFSPDGNDLYAVTTAGWFLGYRNLAAH